MALKFATAFNSVLEFPISSSSTYIEVRQSDAIQMAGILSSPGDFAFLEIINSIETFQPISEIIKVTGVVVYSSTGRLYCERAQEGTSAQNLPAGCFVRHVLAPSTVTAQQPITINTSGGITVNGQESDEIVPGGTANIEIGQPTFTGEGAIKIDGTWPNLTIRAPEVTLFSGPGITSTQIENDDEVSITVSESNRWLANYSFCGAPNAQSDGESAPTFVPAISGGSVEGIAIGRSGVVLGVRTRSLTNGTFQRATVTVEEGRIVSVGPGASESVSVMGVSGRTVVTTPLSGAFQVDLSPSGVSPGAYGPFQIDQFGRVTAAAGGTFISSVQGAGAITTSTVGSTVTVQASTATENSAGVVTLASQAQVLGGNGSGVVQASLLRDGVSALGGVAQAPITAGALGGPSNTNVVASANIPVEAQYALVIGQAGNTTGAFSISIHVGGVLYASRPSVDQRSQTVIAYVNVSGLAELRSSDPAATGNITIIPFR
jgi:hypothetical protein